MSSGREDYDVVVVGGGVMGLFTACHASALGARVAVVECGRVGDPATASFGRTRSYRSDYLDATYARLAHEAFACGATSRSRPRARCSCAAAA